MSAPSAPGTAGARETVVTFPTPESPPTPREREHPPRPPVLSWDLVRKGAPFLTVLLFAGALWLLHEQLAGFHYRDVMRVLRSLPTARLLLAVLATALGYGAMTGYDALAFRYLRNPLPYRKIALASFSGYAFSNSLGFALLTGTPVRARLYSGWGLTALQVTRVVLFCFFTFWLGFITLGGIAFLVEPLPVPHGFYLGITTARPIGLLFLALSLTYLGFSTRRREPLSIHGLEVPLPGLRLALSQMMLSCLDWGLAAATLYALLPGPAEHGLDFPQLLAVFLLAQLAGVASQVPGGLGVLEASILYLMVRLAPGIPVPRIVGALLAFRGIYYFAPLIVASLMLGGYEARMRHRQVLRVAKGIGSRVSGVVPHVLSLTTFLGGAILLVSGATPAVRSRLDWLSALLPLPVIELSHFVGSLIGVGLLLLALGLQRRLDSAFQLTAVLLATGAVVSLLKGFDYEEAIALSLMLAALLLCRRHFYRKSALTNEPFTPAWIAATTIVVAGSLWLGIFSYQNPQYWQDPMWRFTLLGNAPRFLRASVGVVSAALGVALWRLLRPAVHRPEWPSANDLDRAAAVAASSPRTYAYLALLGDKQLLWNPGRTAMLMYGVEGRSWVSMGDPVGPEAERAELAWRFRELCDQHRGWCSFYQVNEKRLHLYVDLGLSLIKLGEEARVPLPDFALLGPARKKLRWAVRKAEELGCRFEVISATQVAPLLGDLESLSEGWLREKNTREKGFSLGFFESGYLQRLPLAVVRGEHGIVAFANLWLGSDREELSIDLMRHAAAAPPVVMDYLFVQLMMWGRANGYRWFNLGMAPLSGLEGRAIAPLWSRLGTLVYRHGEHFYNFQGLRQYKEKFEPVWEPRYLACPGGLALPRVLADVAALISHGFRGLVAK
jgi:phosphatidylglycerol lysyltransferase